MRRKPRNGGKRRSSPQGPRTNRLRKWFAGICGIAGVIGTAIFFQTSFESPFEGQDPWYQGRKAIDVPQKPDATQRRNQMSQPTTSTASHTSQASPASNETSSHNTSQQPASHSGQPPSSTQNDGSLNPTRDSSAREQNSIQQKWLRSVSQARLTDANALANVLNHYDNLPREEQRHQLTNLFVNGELVDREVALWVAGQRNRLALVPFWDQVLFAEGNPYPYDKARFIEQRQALRGLIALASQSALPRHVLIKLAATPPQQPYSPRYESHRFGMRRQALQALQSSHPASLVTLSRRLSHDDPLRQELLAGGGAHR